MPISNVKTLTPQMRRVLGTCLHRGGVAEFDVHDVHERTLMELSRRDLVVSTALQEGGNWRYHGGRSGKGGTSRYVVTTAYRVTLTSQGVQRARNLEAAG